MGKGRLIFILFLMAGVFLSMEASAAKNPATTKIRTAKVPQFDPQGKGSEFQQEAQECDKAAKEAANQCDDQTNPSSQQAQNKNSQYTQSQQQSQGSSLGGGQGTQGECGGLGDLMKAIEPLLKQAAGQCGAGNGKCAQSCEKLKSGAQSKCAGLTDPKQLAACQANAQKATQFAGEHTGSCGAQDANVAAFLAAAANAAMQMMQMKQCQKDTALDCSKPENKEKEECGGKKLLNCAMAEHAQNPQCICQANPRAPGCPGAENMNDATNASKERRDRGGKPNNNLGGGPGGLDQTPLANSAGAKSGLPSGGGGGGGGGSGKGQDAGKGPEGPGPKGLSADILAGDFGGGGPGGKKGGGGYPDLDPRSGKPLAKAKKAEERRIAAQGAATGAFGRSNWQKIRERYIESRPTLNADE